MWISSEEIEGVALKVSNDSKKVNQWDFVFVVQLEGIEDKKSALSAGIFY